VRPGYTRPVWRDLLRDPATLRAYLLTKLAVLALAALATWPLARLLGPRAWWGLGVFALLLSLITAVIVALARVGGGTIAEAEHDDEEADLAASTTVVLEVEDSLDLHSFPPADVLRVVEDYLEAACVRGFSEVRLIHGRGIGVQRERVRSLLSRHPRVASFHDAPPDRGGWGATVVCLRATSDQRSAVSSPAHPYPAPERGAGGGAES